MADQVDDRVLDTITNIDDTIAEYSYLETDPQIRREQRTKFLHDEIWTPRYTYPRLSHFLGRGELMEGYDYEDMRQRAIGAIQTLHDLDETTCDYRKAHLYADFYVARLQRLMLLKTAQEMADTRSASFRATLRHRFVRLNQELYGDFNTPMWLGLIETERRRLGGVCAERRIPDTIVQPLRRFFDSVPNGTREPELIDAALVDTYRPFIQRRYQRVLAVVPDTSPDVVYDAEQSAVIMRRALHEGGFKGWKVAVDTRKANPSTDASTQTISLPYTLSRTANELRRLILHEQEVHARRASNARLYPELSLLRCGTARYAAVEEGLGLFLEIMINNVAHSPAIDRARDRYVTAGLALGAATNTPRDARQTFEILWRLLAVRTIEEGIDSDEATHLARRRSYSHIENAYRGTDFHSAGVAYTKLKVYYEGLVQNVAYMRSIADQPRRFDEVFVGKYDHTNATERQMVLGILSDEAGYRRRAAPAAGLQPQQILQY